MWSFFKKVYTNRTVRAVFWAAVGAVTGQAAL
jgi:hypothetical protein